MNDEAVTAPAALQDKTIQCMDCPEAFVFSAAEQEFFKSKGFTPPKRCQPCRRANKAKKEARNKA